MKNKNYLVKFGLAMVITQIFLLVNSPFAYSYLLNEENFQNAGSSIEDYSNNSNFIEKFGGFLSWFFLIKQIGTVSAQGLTNCCLLTNNGAICQDVIEGINSEDPEGCENPLPTTCAETSQCVQGTCVIKNGESCSANSPKQACENSNGVWDSRAVNNVPECTTGTCVIGTNLQITTKKQCELMSQSKGLDVDFRQGTTELDFPVILGEIKKGACIVSNSRNCRFTTLSECVSISGNFYESILCTNPTLETNCIPTENTMCLNDKVYFVDSCGNAGNVYDSSKVNPDANREYWNEVSDETCSLNLNSDSSIKSCGNCNIFSGSQCSSSGEAGVQTDYGNFACKNLNCVDNKGEKWNNGEKWCLYDGAIGDGKDTVGSEHYLASCNNGKIEVNTCGTARGQICSQRIITQGDIEFSMAACVVNEAIRCIDYNSGGAPDTTACNDNSQCTIRNVNVDEYFKFSMCVPEYPKGFGQKDPQDISSKICSLANQQCTVIYQKQLFGGWKCIANCACETKKFAEEMNNLCVSLGDCGSYVNYIGEGTDNIQVSGAPSVSGAEYAQYAEVEEGKFIELEVNEEFLAAIGTSLDASQFTPEGANMLMAEIGAKGIGIAALAATGKLVPLFNDFIAASKALVTGGNIQFFGTIEGASYVFTGAELLGALGIAAVGNIIGALAGKWLASSLGISGEAATALTMATGILGSAVAIYAAQQGYFGAGIQTAASQIASTAALGWTIVITAIIIAIIIFSGWGKTKQVKVSFSCLPWQAPTGGEDCNACNNDPQGKPCTKYKCESLGQACKLLNENTNNPVCESIQYETSPPVISPEVIGTEGFKFQNPNSLGVEIRTEEGECLPEFNFVDFKLKTSEFAQCKWDFERTSDFNGMNNFPGEGTSFTSNHSFVVGGLSLSFLEASEISGDAIQGFTGNVNMYVKCQDYFGNFNLNDYVVKFCINSGDDITPVNLGTIKTSPNNNAALSFGTKEINFTMWTNEPAECKYSTTPGKNYDSMTEKMTCTTNLQDRELLGWKCLSTLKNLNKNNTFYFKCKDQPWLNNSDGGIRNINTNDFVYNLKVSEGELQIDELSVQVGGSKINVSKNTFTEIKGGDALFEIEMSAKTSKGMNNGVASCSYKWNNQFIPFFNTNSNIHKQKLTLVKGNYVIPVKCEDIAGNIKESEAKFTLNLDSSPPKVVRTFNAGGNLNVITNEEAKCYFSFDDKKQCFFDTNKAEDMESLYSTSHSAKWITGKTYYIKCRDFQDNQNNKCAVQVSTY